LPTRKSNPLFVLRLKPVALSERFVVRGALARWLPEICGVGWLILLAGGIWIHSHATKQTPIFDAFTYYQKAYNFWAAVQRGRWFNPLNIEPTFRPPGTILMSYPFGFSIDPRAFYFRSVYFPVLLVFASVIIIVYEVSDDVQSRWRTVLTAMFFTSMTLAYHFEYGSVDGFWGLVDSFFAGLATLAGACAWCGTRARDHILVWSVATCLISVVAIIVKPSGTLVAAVVGLAWVAFGLATVIECHQSSEWQAGRVCWLALRLLLGAGIIAVGDTAMVAASLSFGYLSKQNLAFGQTAIALMRQIPVPTDELWLFLNAGLGRGLIYWAGLAVLICASALLSSHRSISTVRYLMAIFVCIATFLFGIWFWFVGSGAPTQVRYVVPFFMMTMVWLVPITLRAWGLAPFILRLGTAVVMFATMFNLALLLLLAHPAGNWQRFSGVGVTSDFAPAVLNAFKRFVAQPADHPRSIYVVSFDTNDAILGSIIDESRLLHPELQILSLRRPIDWQRSATIRVNEVEAADALMVNPKECPWAPKDGNVASLNEEQGVFTCWADGLTAMDGIAVFFAAPTVRLLSVVNPAKFRASLSAMVAAHTWDSTFVLANSPLPKAP
jgi:hypothetical protein